MNMDILKQRRFQKSYLGREICIISGMALGIDTAAHIGAKGNPGNTIAVLGSGFNNIYPKENIGLFKEILKNNGTIISEYPPDTMPESKNFPKRNRIISGMAEGVLVVEAMHRSGTTITAKYARKQNREIFCIPSNIGIKTGVGTNKLIQQGAKLITSANDILAELKMDIYKKQEVYEKRKNVKKEYREVYNLITNMPININEICQKTKLDIGKINEIILMLEIENLVKQLPGNEVIRT